MPEGIKTIEKNLFHITQSGNGRNAFVNVDPYDENRFPKGTTGVGAVDPFDENRFPKSLPDALGSKLMTPNQGIIYMEMHVYHIRVLL